MEEFRIITKGNSEISVGQTLPVSGYGLPSATSWSAVGDCGQMLFHHYAGTGFDIWYSNYGISRPVTLMGRTEQPVLEWHIHWDNSFATEWKGFPGSRGYNKQYELSFSPVTEVRATFDGQGRYDTFDLHFQKTFLQPFGDCCPRLARFLEQVEMGKQVRLFNTVRLLTPAMEDTIRSVLQYRGHPQLAGIFIEARVKELLIHLVQHTGLLDRLGEADPMEKRKAREAKALILENFEVYDSVERLARKVGITEHKLQAAFKQVYGMTVGKFSKEERLKKAHELLSSGNETLLSVALMTGYNDAGNFATAFRNFFGYPPGQIQKSRRRG